MRKLLILIALIAVSAVTGCQGGMFASRQRDKDRDRSDRIPDPLMSPDLEEQQRYGRSRYAYPDGERTIAPPTGIDRSTPSGR